MKISRFYLFLGLLYVTLIHALAQTPVSPVGSWKWVNNDTLELKKDLTVWGNNKQIGKWQWIDETKNEFYVIWPSGRKDTLKVSDTGNNIAGVDADGKPIAVVRISAPLAISVK